MLPGSWSLPVPSPSCPQGFILSLPLPFFSSPLRGSDVYLSLCPRCTECLRELSVVPLNMRPPIIYLVYVILIAHFVCVLVFIFDL
jgi:hypothetical protein